MGAKYEEPAPEGFRWICRPWITVKGKRLYASQYGKRAWCFLVPIDSAR